MTDGTEQQLGPLGCEWCRQPCAEGEHECRIIDLYKRIDDMEEAFRFIGAMPFPYRDPDGNDCYADTVRLWCKGMTEGIEHGL